MQRMIDGVFANEVFDVWFSHFTKELGNFTSDNKLVFATVWTALGELKKALRSSKRAEDIPSNHLLEQHPRMSTCGFPTEQMLKTTACGLHDCCDYFIFLLRTINTRVFRTIFDWLEQTVRVEDITSYIFLTIIL